MTQETKNALLLGSILLNIVMIVVFIWFVKYSRETTMKLVAESAEREIAIQEKVLTELASGDEERISTLTNSMHWNIEAKKRLRFKAKTAGE